MADSSTSTPPPVADAGAGATTSADVRTTPPGKKRCLLTLSVLLSFLAGLPFLLSSTAIYRSALPPLRSLPSRPLSSPTRLHALFVRSQLPEPSLSSRLHLSLSSELQNLTKASFATPSCLVPNYTLSVAVDSVSNFPDLDLGGDDDAIGEVLESVLQGGQEGHGRMYTVVVVDVEREEGVRVVVGKHRHAWVIGKIDEEEVAGIVGRIFVEVFLKGGVEGRDGDGAGEIMPVGLDGSVVLSFNLLNADPADGVYDWEFEKIETDILSLIVEALAPIANMRVESQVLYHMPKAAMSYWDDKVGSYVFSVDDLPFFVNSNEWHLDTSLAAGGRSKVLQFVVYVPLVTECPLLLRLPNGEISKTNGFISPMWGGIVVWNPPSCFGDPQKPHFRRDMIATQELQKIFQVFIAQLRLLFGLKSYYTAGMGINFLASERGFAEWELDALFRRHACLNLLSSAATLDSLSKLAESLPRMIVMDDIGKQVKCSLEAASLAQKNASLGIYDASAVSSRKARALAEDSFFHPSIMSISYSSMEHYFAIYMPFFAPVSLHVLLAAIKELKRYRKERAKYLAYVAQQG